MFVRPPLVATLLFLAACSESTAPPGPSPALKSAGGATYTAVDLGSLGGPFAAAWAINDEGSIVGTSTLAGDSVFLPRPTGSGHMFLLPRGGTMTDLGLPVGASHVQPAALNRRNQIAGTAFGATVRAFRWTQAAGYTDLGTLAGGHALANDINAAGHVVGHSSIRPGSFDIHAFLWTPEEGMIDLGTLGGANSNAAAINDRGDIVGFSANAAGIARAFLWTREDGMQDLGALGISNSVFGITNSGLVAGIFQPGDGTLRTFRWTPKGGFTPLGLAEGGTAFAGTALSNAGHIAAQIFTSTFTFISVVNYQGKNRLLRPVGDDVSASVLDINRCGHAVGSSGTAAGELHAVLWTRSCP